MTSRKEIIITAPDIYSEKLKNEFVKSGFEVFKFPVTEISLFDNPLFHNFYKNIKTYDYIILPSRNAVKSFFTHAEKYKVPAYLIQKLNFAVIGKDIDFLRHFGIFNVLKSQEASTFGIYKALKEIKVKKVVVFAPKTEKITEPDIIPDFTTTLKTITETERIDAYITKPNKSFNKEILQKIKKNNYDLIAFTSGGEIEALKYLLNDSFLFSRLKFACFGPYTNSTALKLNIRAKVTGKKFYSFKDFAETLNHYFSNPNSITD
ncbi:MAG: uroporphyrinogen-III synthase [Bacteroidales bacterium]|nr:uroporphyrinogen-III synthase [Bacteroidales bacterium]